MMRCSTREPGLLCPSFITSTPLPKRNPGLSSLYDRTANLSPIVESAVLKNKSLASGHPRSILHSMSVSKRQYLPLVIASSDSEEEIVGGNMPASRKNSIVEKTGKARKTETTTRKARNTETTGKARKTETVRRRTTPTDPQKNFLEEISSETKKKSRRASRVETILNEIVREGMRRSPSPPVRIRSEESIDKIINEDVKEVRPSTGRLTKTSCNIPHKRETLKDDDIVNIQSELTARNVKEEVNENENQVFQFNDDIEIKPVSKLGRRQSRKGKTLPAKGDSNKENVVRRIMKGGHEVDVFLVKDAEMARLSKGLPVGEMPPNNLNERKRFLDDPVSQENAKKKGAIRHSSNALRNPFDEIDAGELNTTADDNIAAKKKVKNVNNAHKSLFDETDLLTTETDTPVIYTMKDVEWKLCKGQNGVFINKTFGFKNTSTGYLKLEAKAVFKLTSSRDQLFTVCEGNGDIKLQDKTSRLTNGDKVKIPSGVDYEIVNRGVKKPLILTYLTWK